VTDQGRSLTLQLTDHSDRRDAETERDDGNLYSTREKLKGSHRAKKKNALLLEKERSSKNLTIRNLLLET